MPPVPHTLQRPLVHTRRPRLQLKRIQQWPDMQLPGMYYFIDFLINAKANYYGLKIALT
jgi:hypothetical protein